MAILNKHGKPLTGTQLGPPDNNAPAANASDMMNRYVLARAAGKAFNGKRDYYDILGYKSQLDFSHYWSRFDRQDIASRIIEAEPKETWRIPPEVTDNEEEEKESDFQKAWEKMVRKLKVWNYFKRVDILSGIGRYGVLLIGTRTGSDLSSPMDDDAISGPEDILYLSPFKEGSANTKKWDTNTTSSRFGRPLHYQIDLKGELQGGSSELSKAQVHYSRVLHIAEELLEDEVFGRPRLKRVFNRLDDLMKVVGGGAETFWLNARQGLVAKAEPDVREFDEEGLNDEIEEYIHGLRRFMRTMGVDIKTLNANVSDPSNHFDIIVSLISAATGIPKRILLGSERGELASSQDERNWLSHIEERQKNYAEPVILRPFIDRMIAVGALPQPLNDEYEVKWESLYSLDKQDEADIAYKKSQTVRNLRPHDPENVVAKSEVREMIGLPKEMPEDELGSESEPDEDDPEVQEYFQELQQRS